jgi:hypothetical protein
MAFETDSSAMVKDFVHDSRLMFTISEEGRQNAYETYIERIHHCSGMPGRSAGPKDATQQHNHAQPQG